ncbi:MAG TPA: peptidylprolyl isomerase [Bacteroidales bacterium]|nr:peptidylprolyl isomerase [Bacteroidales bacterium]
MRPIHRVVFLSLWFVSVACFGQEDRDNTDHLVTIHTGFGKIKILLFDDTPIHKENFIKLAKSGVYDHIIFHRVIDNFMIQTGDYTTRNKPIDYSPSVIQRTIPAEIKLHHKHIRGAVGAARYGGAKNPEKRSSGTQFYMIQNCNGAPHLDGEYTVFGQIMSGFKVIDKIASQTVNERNRPLEEIRITVNVEKVDKKDVEKFYNFTY